MASGQGISDTVTFHTDATIYRCDLDKDKSVLFKATTGRRIFIYLTKGEISVAGKKVEKKIRQELILTNP